MYHMHVLAQVMYSGQNDLTTSICAISIYKQKFTTWTRVDRRGMPKEVTTAKLKKGEVKSAEVEKGMLALKWMDKRLVNMLAPSMMNP